MDSRHGKLAYVMFDEGYDHWKLVDMSILRTFSCLIKRTKDLRVSQ